MIVYVTNNKEPEPEPGLLFFREFSEWEFAIWRYLIFAQAGGLGGWGAGGGGGGCTTHILRSLN